MTFEDDLRRVAEHGIPSAGDNLLGMEVDCYGLMVEVAGLLDDSIRVVRHDGGEPMIEAECRCAPNANPSGVAASLEREWLPKVRYPYFESHRIRVVPEGAELDFVTQISAGSLFVTGRVTIRA